MDERVPNVSKGSTASVRRLRENVRLTAHFGNAWRAALVIWTIATLPSLGCLRILTLSRLKGVARRYALVLPRTRVALLLVDPFEQRCIALGDALLLRSGHPHLSTCGLRIPG